MDYLMYAYCSPRPHWCILNPLCFNESECVVHSLHLSTCSWLCKDKIFSPFHSIEIVLFARVENKGGYIWWEWSYRGRAAPPMNAWLFLLGQFEYVLLFGLCRLRLILLFSPSLFFPFFSFFLLPQKCLHVTALGRGAWKQRCSFNAGLTCSLSSTKGEIDLAESRG